MYTLGKHTGYSSNVVKINLGFLDYVPTSTTGYLADCIDTHDGRINYLINRYYYACTGISNQAMTWDIWAQNWELINTNWENEIY